jgi:hypothetical protein
MAQTLMVSNIDVSRTRGERLGGRAAILESQNLSVGRPHSGPIARSGLSPARYASDGRIPGSAFPPAWSRLSDSDRGVHLIFQVISNLGGRVDTKER